jgi:hypothetical protein
MLAGREDPHVVEQAPAEPEDDRSHLDNFGPRSHNTRYVHNSCNSVSRRMAEISRKLVPASSCRIQPRRRFRKGLGDVPRLSTSLRALLNDPWILFVDFRVSLMHTWRLPGITDVKRGTEPFLKRANPVQYDYGASLRP